MLLGVLQLYAKTVTWQTFCCLYTRGHQHVACEHQVTRKDHVGRPRACFENSIKMMSIVT